jgi:hypothetical protein
VIRRHNLVVVIIRRDIDTCCGTLDDRSDCGDLLYIRTSSVQRRGEKLLYRSDQ